ERARAIPPHMRIATSALVGIAALSPRPKPQRSPFLRRRPFRSASARRADRERVFRSVSVRRADQEHVFRNEQRNPPPSPFVAPPAKIRDRRTGWRFKSIALDELTRSTANGAEAHGR